MRRIALIFLSIASLSVVLLSCDKPDELVFCGKVLNGKSPIPNADVDLAGVPVQTGEDGSFRIAVPRAERYVLNVTAVGFGFVSKIYLKDSCNITISMTAATVDTELVPEAPIVLVDNTPPQPTEPIGTPVNPVPNPLDTLPFVIDGKGRLIAFGAPPEILEIYDAIDDFEPQTEGASVEIPADGLEESDVNAPSTAGFFFQDKKESLKGRKITGSISTVDIYNRDGMPGDYTTKLSDGSLGFMETYGAADINFYSNGKVLQLKQGIYGKLKIPVDTLAQLYYKEKLPATMPLLVYDKKTGLWGQDVDKWTGKKVFAELNQARTAYVAQISHFSVFNMDEEFATPACTRLCNSTSAPDNIPATAWAQVAVGSHINSYPMNTPCTATTTGCPAGSNTFAIARLKRNAPISVRIFDGNPALPTTSVRSSYVLFGGDPSVDIYGQLCTDLDKCKAQFTLKMSPCFSNTNFTTKGAVPAVRKGYDLNGDGTITDKPNPTVLADQGDLTDEADYFVFQWILLESVTAAGAITNGSNQFRIQYGIFQTTDSFVAGNVSQDIDFDTSTSDKYSTAFSTEWKLEFAVPFVGNKTSLPAATQKTTNPYVASSDIIVFRVDYRKVGDFETDGTTEKWTAGSTYYIYNNPTSGTFATSLGSTCYNN
ncbi:MAG TPA: carboxypeptidase-like regulatory domain-containing protein [Cyclobacteriaceae bacterium]|nr:carboxypeptidase-like regulatory domain-containing protein [Cyclobacteriaceae bacterium]